MAKETGNTPLLVFPYSPSLILHPLLTSATQTSFVPLKFQRFSAFSKKRES